MGRGQPLAVALMTTAFLGAVPAAHAAVTADDDPIGALLSGLGPNQGPGPCLPSGEDDPIGILLLAQADPGAGGGSDRPLPPLFEKAAVPASPLLQRAAAAEPPPEPQPAAASPLFARTAAAQAPPPPLAQAVLPPAAEPEEPRRRPGRRETYEPPVTQRNPGAVRAPPPEAFPRDHLPVPDRWRLVEAIGVRSRWFDPYSQNTFKGDRPIGLGLGPDWFLQLNAVSDTLLEPRAFPIPVGAQTTERPGSIDTFGRSDSLVFAQTAILGAGLTKGSTAFKPPDLEFRVAVGLNYNYVDVPERRVLSVLPTRPSHRRDGFVGLQEAFVDYHLRNVSDRYDFDSIRVGIQPFSTDFRGFVFQDNQVGVRIFGNRDNNRFQYNLALFQRIEKDTNSGLNDLGQPLRDDYVAIANLYRQDLPLPGLTSQVTVIYNRNREATNIQVDHNGFPVRPALIGDLRGRDYDVVYLGYNADGRIGRMNLTASAYAALGEDRNSIFTSRPAKIRSFFLAAEPSYDLDWIRVRASALYASGDNNPYDDVERGFDAIQENPQFAGADSSYWIRQTIPFAGGGRAVFLNGRNGILNSLRSSKDEGQSNFNNPGTMLLGAGGDFDVAPAVRISTNLNRLWFADTTTLRVLRQEGSIPRSLGWDYSVAAVWRPWVNQNVVLRALGAVFDPGKGFGDLFTNSGGDDRYYSILLNAILTF